MTRTYKLSILSFLAVAALSCGSDLSTPSLSGLPSLSNGTPGTPYNELMDGRVVPDDAAVSQDGGEVPDGGETQDSGAAVEDGGATGPDGGGGEDVGPVKCPADPFKSARTAADLPLMGKVNGELTGDCDTVVHPLVLAKGQNVHVELWGGSLMADLRIYGPGVRGYLMQNIRYSYGTIAAIEFTADIAGEYFVYVAQNNRRGASPYTVSTFCKDKCGLKATRFPIVMAPGFFGFENIGPITYWWNVADTFSPQGYDLYFAPVDAFNSIEKRGAELAAFVDQVMAQTYARKVDIIAHSQGGLDSRYIISGLGYADKVGMLNMVASPHRGTSMADAIVSDPTGIGAPLLNALGVICGAVLSGPEAEQNMMASMNSMTTWNMADFNLLYPDSAGVSYRSWAGKSCYSWESNCKNPVNIYLMPTFEYLRSVAGDNDGVVQSSSTVWTGFQGYLDADHFDEIGQLFGATGSFEHLKFYQGVVDSMRAAGY